MKLGAQRKGINLHSNSDSLNYNIRASLFSYLLVHFSNNYLRYLHFIEYTVNCCCEMGINNTFLMRGFDYC